MLRFFRQYDLVRNAVFSIWRGTRVLNQGLFDKKMMLLGSADLARKMVLEIGNNKSCGYRVAAVANEGKEFDCCPPDSISNFCLECYDDLCSRSKTVNIDKIFVAIEDRRKRCPQ